MGSSSMMGGSGEAGYTNVEMSNLGGGKVRRRAGGNGGRKCVGGMDDTMSRITDDLRPEDAADAVRN